jgi:hypothetical protein
VAFVICDVQGPVMDELRRDGLIDLIGEEHLFDDPSAVLAAYPNLPPEAQTTPPEDATGTAPPAPKPTS